MPAEGDAGELRRRLDRLSDGLRSFEPALRVEEHGRVFSVGEGVARVEGLPGVESDELLVLGDGVLGLALDLRETDVGVALLDQQGALAAGADARRTGRVLEVPVGPELFGRVIDPVGRPLDGRGSLGTRERLPIERAAPPIMDRAPVSAPLVTGLKVIDALIPIGRGQRQLIVGDRQTGKTAIALDAMLCQAAGGGGERRPVSCVYCAIGLRASSIARLVEDLESRGALETVSVVATTEENPPGLRHAAPYAAMSIAERVMHGGGDALVVFDDLTRHARAYRELSLLLRRPPGREAYPGDIFYVHSRLLERSTHLRDEHGGGSVTALPIVETQAQDISAYIPTNLISITDGQVYLSPRLQQRGVLPAVDVGRSVSRVGGKTQHAAFRAIAGSLRLSYSQFEELEAFARFAARLDEDTQATLRHGRRVREILKQPQYAPLPLDEQLVVLFAAGEGLLDGIDVESVPAVSERLVDLYRERPELELGRKVRAGGKLDEATRRSLLDLALRAVEEVGREEEEEASAAASSRDGEDEGS